MSNYLGDLQQIETADGLIETFGGGTQAIQVYGGYGMPPLNFITIPNMNLVGVVERDFALLARPMALELWIQHATDLDAYWDNRNRLHDLLRPNRGGEMLLTLQLPNMERRCIYVRANPGLEFQAEPGNNAWLIDQPLDLLAHNPVWFDPTLVSYSSSNSLINELVFPATFAIMFGYAYFTVTTGQFVYAGTWQTYPLITLTGPYETAQIVNGNTQAQINMISPIENGQIRFIDLTPGAINVTDENGESVFEEVDPASDFVQFAIKSDPEIIGGYNQISAQLVGGVVGTSDVTISFYNRYIGI